MDTSKTFILAGLALLFSTPALYGDVLYTSLAAFEANTSNDTTITFTASCSTCFADYTTYTDSGTGTSFSLATPYINLTGKDYYSPGYPMDLLIESSSASAVANTLTVTPPADVSAIGFNIGSFNGSTFVVTLSDGSSFNITPPGYSGLSFFGFSSSAGITSLTLETPANDTFVIDEAIIGGTVPEPSSVGLAAAALASFVLLCRRPSRITAEHRARPESRSLEFAASPNSGEARTNRSPQV
jgi:hypothetical protein